VTLPQFAVIPLAVLLVWIGLGRGIEPLNRLGRMIRRRLPTDLSPIPTAGVPEEVKPVIYAFNDMMARLEQNLQAQQRFIGDAAHQMRTPLTGLKMQTELALSETDPENMRTLLRQIAESTDRAAHLTSQLLALARAESSHKKTHEIELVDIEAQARQVTLEWVPRAMQKNIDLGFEGTGWPLQVTGNPLLLRELAVNLIDNAVKYTPEGGRVTVRTRAGEFAVLEVEDDGPGIPDNERELVFERFYRVLGNEAPGSGLGLAIVREIAELHLGSVQLKPGSSGRGTVAQAVFPRRRFTVSALLSQQPEKFQPSL
jgi:two-component system sensor histidine kinase TctE